jgi:hypothetical protein
MQVGQQVQGIYCGDFQFCGVITEMRRLTVKTDGCFEYVVALAKPMTVFGVERSELLINAKFDGAASSYTRFSDYMQLA